VEYVDQLSDHWAVHELCRLDDWVVLAADLSAQLHLQRLVAAVLEPLRLMWSSPLVSVSGYRSPAHNAAVNGASQSQHMLGKACDVTPADVEWQALRAHFLGHAGFEEFTAKMAADQARIKQLDLLVEHALGRELEAVGGVGLYLESGWLHLDIRPRGLTGHVARWRGNDFGSEQ
jgi:uncharacterized protein YcbK (DUF882 family)